MVGKVKRQAPFTEKKKNIKSDMESDQAKSLADWSAPDTRVFPSVTLAVLTRLLQIDEIVVIIVC